MLQFQILFLLLVTLYCLRAKIEHIICLLCLLLPFHGTVKTIYIEGADLFSFWKEAVVLLLFYRVYKKQRKIDKKLRKKHKKRKSAFRFLGAYKMLVVFALLYALVGLQSGYSISADIRNLTIPGLLLISMYNCSLSRSAMFKIFTCILLPSCFMNVTGVMDFADSEMRLAFRTLMEVEMTISETTGEIYYTISSYKIMGLDRVCGLMAGGPNQMGVYNAFVVVTCMTILYSARDYLKNNACKCLFVIAFALSFFCLVTSFSRAGWAICFMTLLLYWHKNKVIKTSTIFMSFVGLALLVGVFYYSIDLVQRVIDGTFSGEESSSATRGSMTLDALEYLLFNPWGAGLGATMGRGTDEKTLYFAESAFVNMAICIGVVGFCVLSGLYLSVYKKLKANMQRNQLAIWSSSFLIAIYITSFVSVNPLENPFVYYSWLFMGLGLLRKNERNINSHRDI